MRSDNIFNAEKDSKLTFEQAQVITEKKQALVLVGNPNVGKSLFFNYLSGMYVDVSNFPGTTVSISKAVYKNYDLFDTPGIYGVSSFNDEEEVARDVILSSDIVINVVNSLHLERDLFLTVQLIDMGKKVVVLLNFSDEIIKRNIRINDEVLSEMLGVPVIKTSAANETGFERLDEAIESAKTGNQQLELQFLLQQIMDKGVSQSESLLILEGDEIVAKRNNVPCGTPDEREKIYVLRRNQVNEVVSTVEHEDSKKGEFFNLLGNLSLNPKTGIPLLAIVLTLVYFFIGDFISQRVVGYTENTLGINTFEYYTKSYVSEFTEVSIDVELADADDNIIDQKIFNFPEGMESSPADAKKFKDYSSQTGSTSTFHFKNKIVRLFFGEFGIVTMTVTYLLFLLMPLVIGFYFVMALLEDSGYLPRLATMLDRSLNRIGLNGRAVIPIMLGFGCVTMANITTRLLGTNREKTIVTAILQFAIPCSAQLAVVAVLLSGAGFGPMVIYASVIFTVLISLSTVLNKLIPGESSPLLIDLPVMQVPKLKNVLKKTIFRTSGFMKEAGVWFFVGAIAVGLMEITGILYIWQDILEPLTTKWLLLPKEAANAFVMGMVRRDFGAAGLFDMSLTSMQMTVAIITITLFVPCIASFVVMLKERGWKEGLSIWFGTWITAFLVGGIVAQIII